MADYTMCQGNNECRDYIENQKEYNRKKSKKYYSKNKDACKARTRKWMDEHKEYMKQYKHEYYERNKDELKAKRCRLGDG